MGYTLEVHSQGYGLSSSDIFYGVVSGFSGFPYAQRHWELSSTDSAHAWVHMAVAGLEALPLLGVVVALCERVTVATYRYFVSTPRPSGGPPPPPSGDQSQSSIRHLSPFGQLPLFNQPQPVFNRQLQSTDRPQIFTMPQEPMHHLPPLERLPPSETLQGRLSLVDSSSASEAIKINMKKMWVNGERAMREHVHKAPAQPFATPEQALSSLKEIGKNQELKFAHTSAEHIGLRPSMEDAHFVKDIDQGILAGVFDGHGGEAVAKHANTRFQELFPQVLQANQGDVYRAFTHTIDQIHEEVVKEGAWNLVGSTAVVCFVDKETCLAYTATLADSEATIYRDIEGKLVAMPLSCVRDWSCKRDAERAAKAVETTNKWDAQEMREKWPNHANPKGLRFGLGLNVSRAIGDKTIASSTTPSGMSHKPKITVNEVKTGDTLILGCDGLKDYTTESEIIEKITESGEDNLAQKLVDFAVKNKGAKDNVTVIAIKFT